MVSHTTIGSPLWHRTLQGLQNQVSGTLGLYVFETNKRSLNTYLESLDQLAAALQNTEDDKLWSSADGTIELTYSAKTCSWKGTHTTGTQVTHIGVMYNRHIKTTTVRDTTRARIRHTLETEFFPAHCDEVIAYGIEQITDIRRILQSQITDVEDAEKARKEGNMWVAPPQKFNDTERSNILEDIRTLRALEHVQDPSELNVIYAAKNSGVDVVKAVKALRIAADTTPTHCVS